jgi:succinate dehydrogenase / fumarate reductase cytochrome b subunit
MQFAEILHMAGVADVDIANATNGVYWIKETFANPIYVGLYLVWLAAIWFHLTHGVWSAMHSLGLNNGIWMKRVKCISNIVSTVVVLMFAVVVVYYFAMSLCA